MFEIAILTALYIGIIGCLSHI